MTGQECIELKVKMHEQRRMTCMKWWELSAPSPLRRKEVESVQAQAEKRNE